MAETIPTTMNEDNQLVKLERHNAIEPRDFDDINVEGLTIINIPINSIEHVYCSFSYLITEWIKKTMFKDKYSGFIKKYNENEISFPRGFNSLMYRIFQSDSIRHHDDIDTSSNLYTYTLDLLEEPIIFKYKEMVATIKIIKEKSTMVVVKDFRSLSHLFGIICVSFENKYQLIFNEILEYASKSFDEFREISREDKVYTCIYLAEEGGYWDLIQKKNKRSIDTVYLPESDKKMIITDLENFLKPETKTLYEKFCITYKRVYLFEGVPGSGKSSFIHALASNIGYGLAILNFNLKLDDNGLMKTIKNLPKKTFLLIEDVDCIFENRKAHDTDKNGISFSGLLNSLDGISTNHGFICFITTNYKNRLEQALIRPGRVDIIYKFDYATQEQIKDIYKSFMWLTFDEDEFKTFYSKLQTLRIKITMNLLHQYLFIYLNKPNEALNNIETIRTYYNDSKISKDIEDVEMYS